jgi:hypothetical protein
MLKTMANTPSDAETNLVAETMSSGGSDGGSKRRLLLLSPLFLLFLCLSLFFASSASSHGTGLLSITGREAAAGSGSRVALAAAAWGADSEEVFPSIFSLFFSFLPLSSVRFFSPVLPVSVLFSIYRKKCSRCAFNHATAGRPVTRSVV